ncbi:hypothetical protein WJX81_008270 [Elliptochloris bilobata]|uniref:Major facilitator superfamily (MFS) profile domain-containing protein n=1 Tax=Elliptochloris bilobata TaxID=381761 RepID=A0AAW1QKI2_9CHLO
MREEEAEQLGGSLISENNGDDCETYTVGEAIDQIGFGRFQVVLLLYCGCAWAADAMEMMLLSFLGPAVRCEWGLTPSQEGLITSVVFLGTMAGATLWGRLADACGRRVGFFGTAVFTFAFGLASAGSPNYPFLLAFRGLVGLGLGGAPVAFALYLEFAPSRHRGALLVALQAFWTIGSMVEAALAWGVLTRLGWRWLLALSSIPLLALTVLYPVLPESPFFLAATGRTSAAAAVLQHMARANGRPLPPLTLQAHPLPTVGKGARGPAPPNGAAAGRSSAALEAWKRVAAPVVRLLSPALRRTSLLLLLIWFTNALNYYGLVLLTTTLNASDESACRNGRLRLEPSALAQIFIASTAELPGLLLAAMVMDLIGRKWSLAGGLLLVAVFTAGLLGAAGSTLTTALLFCARAASMGAFAILYVYTPEAYPTTARTFALGCNNAMSRVGALLAPFLAVDLASRSTAAAHGAEGIIAGACFVAAAATAALPLETRGCQLTVTGEPGEGAKLCGKPGAPRNAGMPSAHNNASLPRNSATLV